MMDEHIDQMMQKICDVTATAAYRYMEVSCEPADQCMAEHFMASSVLDKIGSAETTMTLETSVRRLRMAENRES